MIIITFHVRLNVKKIEVGNKRPHTYTCKSEKEYSHALLLILHAQQFFY